MSNPDAVVLGGRILLRNEKMTSNKRNIPSVAVQLYLRIASSGLIQHGGGRNIELAFHVLALCRGDLDAAVRAFVQGTRGFALPPDHHLLTYNYQESEVWSQKQIDAFHHALISHDKDFR